MSEASPSGGRKLRRIAWIAAGIATPVALFLFVRWLREPTYEGTVRFPCGSIRGTVELSGPIDPKKRIFITDSGYGSEPKPGAIEAYQAKVLAVQLVELSSGEIVSPAFAVNAARFTGIFGGVRTYRRICSAHRTFQYWHMPIEESFASDSSIANRFYLICADSRSWVTPGSEDHDWRVFEFNLEDYRRRHVAVPDLTELPTLAEHPRGEEMWGVYSAAFEEDRQLEAEQARREEADSRR